MCFQITLETTLFLLWKFFVNIVETAICQKKPAELMQFLSKFLCDFFTVIEKNKKANNKSNNNIKKIKAVPNVMWKHRNTRIYKAPLIKTGTSKVIIILHLKLLL